MPKNYSSWGSLRLEPNVAEPSLRGFFFVKWTCSIYFLNLKNCFVLTLRVCFLIGFWVHTLQCSFCNGGTLLRWIPQILLVITEVGFDVKFVKHCHIQTRQFYLFIKAGAKQGPSLFLCCFHRVITTIQGFICYEVALYYGAFYWNFFMIGI